MEGRLADRRGAFAAPGFGRHRAALAAHRGAGGAIHQRRWWNALIGNPAGYLPSPGDVDAVHLGMPRPEFLPLGPEWLRGWMAYFFGVVIVLSLLLKFLWRLH